MSGTRKTSNSRPGPTARPAVAAGRSLHAPCLALRRWLFLGLVTATTLGGAGLMLDILRAGGTTPLEIAILALFAATFCWIGIAFWNAVIGFALLLLRRDPLSLRRAGGPRGVEGDLEPCPITTRTALVMPVYEEDPDRVMRRLAATIGSLVETGEARHFDVYLLSDTADPATARREEAAWEALCARWSRDVDLFYRRRADNAGRKAGNIADFCRRWGDRYDYMVPLDADSVMTGPTLVELVRTMEANPDAGLVQTVPVPAGQTSLLGRLLQFAACLYSPVLAAGQSFWQGDAANYWGHNAIVHVRAFTENCGLPVLPGGPPLGGEILSHDFVEAALLRRAGWRVWLLPSLAGSHEDVPATIPDYARRDRRWAQGSLQHLRLLPTPGLHRLSRVHFALGAMGYVSSLLWLLMLLASTAYILLDGLAAGSGLDALVTGPRAWFDGWPLPDVHAIGSLLVVTGVVLFAPKLLAVALALVRRRKPFGGCPRLLASALLEMIFGVVVAPLMMMFHSRFVLEVLSGRRVTWRPQRRDGRDLSWGASVRAGGWITAVGVAWAGLTLHASPAFFLWLTPILLGLLLAAPLVRWTSSRSLGLGARRLGLFLAPSEALPPPGARPSPASPLPASRPPARPERPDTDREPESSPAGLHVVPPERPVAMPRQALRPGGASRPAAT